MTRDMIPGTSGFNGAAPMKERKPAAIGGGVATTAAWLQRGRSDEGAETS